MSPVVPVFVPIADSWPRSVDDGAAHSEWGWSPDYDLATMTGGMLDKLKAKLKTVG